jgi:hypothetical protein
MERLDFAQLSTEQFRKRMRPAALRIYERVFPGCEIEDLRAAGVRVHILDQEFGIDSLIKFPSRQWITIQEKYRDNSALRYLDFTQEYMNAEGTRHESPGEWFKLGAQLYFYGWAARDESDFEKWAILDVAKYKLLVENAGGIQKLGVKRQNNKHGRSSFFAIPIRKLQSAFVADYRAYQSEARGAEAI